MISSQLELSFVEILLINLKILEAGWKRRLRRNGIATLIPSRICVEISIIHYVANNMDLGTASVGTSSFFS